ncbi:hypothetical protein L1987_24018 [Smallanthus sonchifolius]|uniref:Uncharacterized protein n=1 Tax=Smallanthus sonchifolius TaxID=185202 RepID=A0ACB9IKR1_9ASTR|nr:hypothetical protein L1987_24018 [Smallanthus sonchifolius]
MVVLRREVGGVRWGELCHTIRQAKRVKPVSLATPNENDKKTEAGKIINKQNENAYTDNNPNEEIEMGSATFLPLEDQAQPSIVPPVDFEKQESPVVNPTVRNTIPQDAYGHGGDMQSDSPIHFSMKDLWTYPCIEFAVKTLTGSIPFGDLNKPENLSPSPLQELWTDPCIEFAVKTLTCAIPVRGR